MAANREGVGNIKPVRALCPFYCVCNTCIHIYIYIAHGSGAHSRSLAWGTDVPLPGRLPGPALVGPLQGPLRVLGPPGGIRPGPAALAPRSRARRDSSAAAALPRREELRAEPRPLLAVGSDSGEGGGQENCRGEEEEAEGGQGRGPVHRWRTPPRTRAAVVRYHLLADPGVPFSGFGPLRRLLLLPERTPRMRER